MANEEIFVSHDAYQILKYHGECPSVVGYRAIVEPNHDRKTFPPSLPPALLF